MSEPRNKRWRRSPGWGVVDQPDAGEHGGQLFAAALVEGTIHRVEGPAAIVARAALAGKDVQGICLATATALDVDADSIDAEVVTELLSDLVELGLLLPVPASSD